MDYENYKDECLNYIEFYRNKFGSKYEYILLEAIERINESKTAGEMFLILRNVGWISFQI